MYWTDKEWKKKSSKYLSPDFFSLQKFFENVFLRCETNRTN